MTNLDRMQPFCNILLDGALHAEFLVAIDSKGQGILYNGNHEIGGISDKSPRFIGGQGLPSKLAYRREWRHGLSSSTQPDELTPTWVLV